MLVYRDYWNVYFYVISWPPSPLKIGIWKNKTGGGQQQRGQRRGDIMATTKTTVDVLEFSNK